MEEKNMIHKKKMFADSLTPWMTDFQVWLCSKSYFPVCLDVLADFKSLARWFPACFSPASTHVCVHRHTAIGNLMTQLVAPRNSEAGSGLQFQPRPSNLLVLTQLCSNREVTGVTAGPGTCCNGEFLTKVARLLPFVHLLSSSRR